MVTKEVLKADLKELELRLVIRLSVIMGSMFTIFFAALSATMALILKDH